MTSADMKKIYIDGEWISPKSCEWIEVRDPFYETVTCVVPDVGAEDVDRAVAAARTAGRPWADAGIAVRLGYLAKLYEELAARHDVLVEAIVSDVGTPRKIAERIQVGLPLTVLKSYFDLGTHLLEDEKLGNSLVVFEPIGVVAAVTPWNYPLHLIMCKVAPALLAGATIVLKPSEVAPLVAWELTAAVHAAGFPPGVFNILSGTGPRAGEALVGHADVNMVSFTGSEQAGAKVAALATGQIKRVALELGGKSANVVLNDADLQRAVKYGVSNAFLNAGQTCTALTRLLVPQELHEEAVSLAKSFVESFVPGDPRDPSTRLGPLVSSVQRERVRGFINRGIESGARLVTGGASAPAERSDGYFVRPTLFADVDPNSELAQEEIFGPVLSVIPYRDEEHALEIANGTRYGLAGAVWSANEARAMSFARRMSAGSIDLNGAAFNVMAPFGGMKKSGFGRELGRWALHEFIQTKSIQYG